MNRIPFIGLLMYFFSRGFFLVKNLAGWKRRHLPLCLILAAVLWVGEPLEAWQCLG